MNAFKEAARRIDRKSQKLRAFAHKPKETHIPKDHGKSTLADRLLELTGVVKPGERNEQLLDRLPVERERGITVKAQTAALPYKDYLLNLIDTPGHVDFSAEVSRSLAVCDGILLVVAANQGVQAQTIANFWLAFERNISMIPVINKIDLSGANIHKVETQLKNLFEFDPHESLKISAKSGLNVSAVLEAIVQRIPPPTTNKDAPFRAQIFDCIFDHFRGAIAFIRVTDGSVQKGQKIRSFHHDKEYEVAEVGIMRPDMTPCSSLSAGQVGYVICSMKTVKEASVGETLYAAENSAAVEPFPGFKPIKPTVYAGLFPVETSEYEGLKQAVERLSLNDPSVVIMPDSSPALGLGWKVGFLGVLHMEVFGARLDQEYGASVILSQPSVEYRAIVKDNETIRKKRFGGKSEISILDASKFPEEGDIEKFLESVVKVRMIVPAEMMGAVNGLCTECRGERGEISSIDEDRLMIVWRLPLAEGDFSVVIDFFERLKRLTSGYASFDYEQDGYIETKLIKLTITINGREVPEFSQIIPAAMAKERAKLIVQRLKREIPRQQYEVTIKETVAACVGNSTKALSHVSIQPMKRDFTQLLKGNFGGGGMERLNKKLSHQKKGKERMKQIGNVQIPKEAFLNVLRN
ncbi:GTP-binding protein LepA [Oesophagostomum dentatum]|uniref:Translation factor GUF1 homolog, mitochondrial n=1 Tax=Oesophagostomum dentatum TaxID=61180 RepID=A0A0B1TMK5_OESDE|nr:GTP-binding protein LepA [Oesophagostomum dentatum]